MRVCLLLIKHTHPILNALIFNTLIMYLVDHLTAPRAWLYYFYSYVVFHGFNVPDLLHQFSIRRHLDCFNYLLSPTMLQRTVMHLHLSAHTCKWGHSGHEQNLRTFKIFDRYCLNFSKRVATDCPTNNTYDCLFTHTFSKLTLTK